MIGVDTIEVDSKDVTLKENRLVESIASELETNGIAILPPLIGRDTLTDMQTAFAAQLKYFRLNNVGGYHRTEQNRIMVEDVLTLAQGFVDIGVHPLVTRVLARYIGGDFALCEAKGWASPPTKSEVGGWHGDEWYDKAKVTANIPRDVKLAFYLTDVNSGAFQYAKGTHGRRIPSQLTKKERTRLPDYDIMSVIASAGTAFLFDTSGIHRQSVPILDMRHAVFYDFHNPNLPIQKEDYDYYRYRPLSLNAAFLGNLTGEQCRILGFGNQGRLRMGYNRPPLHPMLHKVAEWANMTLIKTDDFKDRVTAFTKKILQRGLAVSSSQ